VVIPDTVLNRLVAWCAGLLINSGASCSIICLLYYYK
jgi:hypothetical protein